MAASLSSFPAPSSKPTKTQPHLFLFSPAIGCWSLHLPITINWGQGSLSVLCVDFLVFGTNNLGRQAALDQPTTRCDFFFLLVHYAERRVSMVSSLWVLDRCTVRQLRSMSFECLPSPSPALRARREAFTAWGTMWWYVSSYLKVLTQRSHFSLPYPLSNSFLSLSSLLISHPRFKVLQVSFFVFCQPTRTHMEQVSICS